MSLSASVCLSHHPFDTQNIDENPARNKIKKIILSLTISVIVIVIVVLLGIVLILKLRTQNQQQLGISTISYQEINITDTSENRTANATCRLPLYPTYNKNGTTVIGITDKSGYSILNPELKLLYAPSSLYLNSKNDIYISDYTIEQVIKYPPDNDKKGIIAATGRSERLGYLHSIYINRRNDDLYILAASINGNYRVLYLPINATADDITVILATNNNISEFLDMDFDDNFNIYINEFRNHRVVKWLAPTYENFEVVAGNETEGTALNQLRYPRGVYIDRKTNDLYTADYNGIRVWSPSSRISRTVIKNIDTYPSRITRDCHGNFYILDQVTLRFYGASTDITGLYGTVLVGLEYAGLPPQSSPVDYFGNAIDMYHDEETGDLYILDNFRFRVQKYTINGELSSSS